jgi:hypothetical protein
MLNVVILSVIMLSVIVLSVIVLSVIMLSVIILSVVASFEYQNYPSLKEIWDIQHFIFFLTYEGSNTLVLHLLHYTRLESFTSDKHSSL